MTLQIKMSDIKKNLAPELPVATIKPLTAADCRRELKALNETGQVTSSLQNLVKCRA